MDGGVQDIGTATAADPPHTLIAVAHGDADRAAVFRLRYAVSVVELGKCSTAANHADGLLCDELDEGDRSSLFFAKIGDTIVASLRVSWGGLGIPDDHRDLFALDRFAAFPGAALSFTSRLVVAPAWRNTPVLGQLLVSAYQLARERGVRFNFCHCTPALVTLYEQLGYRRYRTNIVAPDVGYHVPLVLLTEDAGHLDAVRSPFRRSARRLANPPDSAAWFKAAFPDYAEIVTPHLRSETAFLQALARFSHQTRVPLFTGMADEEVKAFIREATVLQCRTGDPIIRAGEVGRELFVILSGAVEVRRDVQGQPYTLTTFGTGQIFGELAFLSERPRTANVVAISDLELLVLSQAFFHRIRKTMPDVALKVLLNLSLTLCERIEASTQGWVTSLEHGPPGT